MGKAHPMELRSRVVAFVEQGHGHREAAWHFRVSPRFVNDMVILKRASRGLLPMVQGTHAEGKLVPFQRLAAGSAARTCQALWSTVGRVCDPFPKQECLNYFKAAGYGLN